MTAARVTIAGAGIAGMTAALRLAERGYAVTLYEEKGMLGGNLASRARQHGGELDVYPHMLQGWYLNFWRLIEDIGVEREESFSPFASAHQIRKGEYGKYATLTRPYSPRYVLRNLASGFAPPLDMFVFGCANLDLLAELANPTVRLTHMSLTGYLNTRLYMTKRAIEAFETFISKVWAVPGYQILASDCLTHSSYCYGSAELDDWLTRAPAAEAFIDRLKDALTNAHVRIVLNTRIDGVELDRGRVSRVVLQGTRFDPRKFGWLKTGRSQTVEVENLLLAVPPVTLAHLATEGRHDHRIVDAIPRFAALRRLDAQAVPMLQLCLTRKLPNLPSEPVALFGSELNLAFTDVSQRWDKTGQFGSCTALAVSCSERNLLPGPSWKENAYAILQKLSEYVELEPGDHWEASPDINWSMTRFHENDDAKLTINAVGTEEVRPEPACEEVPNLFFAGDFCQNEFGITTTEAAVATGLAAADAIVRQCKLGHPVEIKTARKLNDMDYAALRLAWLPAAYTAKLLSMFGTQRAFDGADAGREPSLLRYMLTPGLPPLHRRPGS